MGQLFSISGRSETEKQLIPTNSKEFAEWHANNPEVYVVESGAAQFDNNIIVDVPGLKVYVKDSVIQYSEISQSVKLYKPLEGTLIISDL